MKFIKFAAIYAAALVLLSSSVVINAAEPETDTIQPDGTETVSGNDPLLPSDDHTEQTVETDGGEQQYSGIEGLLEQASETVVRLEGIKETLENMLCLVEELTDSMETNEENHTVFYEGILENLSDLSMYIADSGNGVMLLSDDVEYYASYLSDYYNSELGFVVLPNRGAFEYYWSRSYYYISKSGMSWFGVDYIAYRDVPYLHNNYGYDINTDSGSWVEANDGCYVETVNLSAYEAALVSGEPDEDEPEPDETLPGTGEIFSQLETINETMSAMQETDYAYYESSAEFQKEMRMMQTAETASSIILCILLCVVLGIMTFTEFFRRFK